MKSFRRYWEAARRHVLVHGNVIVLHQNGVHGNVPGNVHGSVHVDRENDRYRHDASQVMMLFQLRGGKSLCVIPLQ